MKRKRQEILKKTYNLIPDCIFWLVPDRLYVKFLYFYSYGEFPDLKNPKTFDEKLQWYKLYYRKPEMTALADKYEVRKYVESKNLGHILNELYFVKDKLEIKDIEELPDSYVIKTTHGCNMNVIKEISDDKDVSSNIKMVNKWLRKRHYYHGREWAYKNIKPRIICEKYLKNEEFGELIDYKFYCFSGKADVVFACAGRFSEEGVGYNAYDMDWNKVNVHKGKPGVDIKFNKPENFDEMKEIAEILAGGYPFIRVDLYSVEGKTVFGELTFYPDSGIIPFTPDEYNYYLGDLFKIR
ncbi:MAG: glycosyl transferase [Clostridiales bacterium]|nr:glycosyl transferase [Clostridiales bacterium]